MFFYIRDRLLRKQSVFLFQLSSTENFILHIGINKSVCCNFGYSFLSLMAVILHSKKTIKLLLIKFVKIWIRCFVISVKRQPRMRAVK